MTKEALRDASCLFCKIISGDIPSAKILENESFIAILDKFPNTKGQTVVIPRAHTTSDVFNSDFKLVHKGLDFAKDVANLLKLKLNASRIALVTEGVFIDHLHLKLFPIYNEEKFKGDLGNDKVFYKEFPGFLTTHSGPEWSGEELGRLADVINS